MLLVHLARLLPLALGRRCARGAHPRAVNRARARKRDGAEDEEDAHKRRWGTRVEGVGTRESSAAREMQGACAGGGGGGGERVRACALSQWR